jgi:Flp pilus assembly pilin Flp
MKARLTTPGRSRLAQNGQVATEYLVVVAAIALALIVPVNGGQSAAQLLATAIRNFFLNFSFMVSVS